MNTTAHLENAGSAAFQERLIVVFRLGDAVYGTDIQGVREIIRRQEITPVPNVPDYIEGVTNLRGKICPIMDLRRRFALEPGPPTGDTRIVVLEIDGGDVGIIVDGVAEVLRVAADRIEQPAASIFKGARSGVVEGIANLDGRLIVLIDVGRILSEAPVEETERIAA